MKIKEPYKIYTAATNIEAHVVVGLLHAGGIDAYAEEDQSGLSLWAFGTISQFHQPNVWIEKSAASEAAELIHCFEEKKRLREGRATGNSKIEVECETCGKTSHFPENQNGTTQECSHCHGYVDVGEWEWNEGFDEGEDSEVE